jgi:hypothetical protein
MTGAEKTLKWYREFVKTNGVYPLIKEVESQLEMAVDEEKVSKNESIGNVMILPSPNDKKRERIAYLRGQKRYERTSIERISNN